MNEDYAQEKDQIVMSTNRPPTPRPNDIDLLEAGCTDLSMDINNTHAYDIIEKSPTASKIQRTESMFSIQSSRIISIDTKVSFKDDIDEDIDDRHDLHDKNDQSWSPIKKRNSIVAVRSYSPPPPKKTPPIFVSTKQKIEPLMQAAQKCPWCGRYLCGDAEIATYNGYMPEYQGWMCHAECNLN